MREQSYKEFRLDVCNTRGPHKMKVVNSWGIYDVYKFIRKKHWYDIGRPLKEHEFYSIVRQINKLLAENIARGITVRFPAKMGLLELRKEKKGVSFVDGKLKVTYPIDWNETIKLWYIDEEAHKEKTLVRNETEYIYHVRYSKFEATYENKIFYQFDLNTFIKRALKEKILSGETDTLYGYGNTIY